MQEILRTFFLFSVCLVAEVVEHHRSLLRCSCMRVSENLSERFKKTLGTFPKNSRNISEKLSEHFRKTLGTFQKNSRKNFGKLSEHYGWENKKYIFTKQKVQFREGVFMLTKSPNHKMFHGIIATEIQELFKKGEPIKYRTHHS